MSAPRFKTLTASNWLEPDPVLQLFVGRLVDGQPQPLTGDDWLGHILAATLADAVPQEIQELFAVARGALAYGYFFYPLYALAFDQAFRVAEAATEVKCRRMGAPALPSFRSRVEWLSARKVWDAYGATMWGHYVTIRNEASHPKYQSIQSPGGAIETFWDIAARIDALFVPVTEEERDGTDH